MKKLLLSMLAIAAVFATSCEKDADLGTGGETSTVSFSVGTPDIATRAYSDGMTATVLEYAVYDVNGNELTALTKEGDDALEIEGSTTVNLQLTTGNTYSVIFWAAAEGAPYDVDFDAKTMTVDYTGALSNDENRDAFYKYHTFTVKGAQTETIELKRPFAQLNIGTNDYVASANAGYTPTQSAVTVKNIYETLNLATGAVSDETAAAFALADIKKDETFPVAGNEYLAMNYLLVGADKETVDVEFTYTDGSNAKTRTVGSVPVQRNHRTNIYGKLLTSDVDINVEIKPEYNEPDYSLYNVVVDGVSYDDLRVAVAKAMEIGKPVEFIQNVTIDADETITVPAGKTLTLNLNGYTLSGVTDQIGSNRNMFDVRGEMTVNGNNTLTRAGAAEGNGCITIKHVGDNMGWGASTNVFNVTAGGVLNIKNVHAINFGGSDMGFVAHLNNWGEVTLNVENSTLSSNYVAVRVFNSGNDKNNVTIYNSILKGGSYAFWVHNFTVADFGTQEKVDAHMALLNFDIFNGTNTFIGKNETPIRFGFTNALYADENGVFPIIEDDEVVEGIGMDMYGNYAVSAANGLNWIAEQVDGDVTFEDKTIILLEDIDLTTSSNWNPIGDNRTDKAFKGTFDGNNKTITGAHITGDDCFNGAVYGSKEGWGLFSVLDGATVKDLKVDGAIFASYTVISGTIAGYAKDTTFENIDITNTKIAGYNWYTGGVVGWAQGECTFRDINLDDTVSVGTLWDSHGQNAGGIAGGVSADAKITIEDCNIACVMDVINDVTSNYKWYIYRVSGMIIGNTNTTETKYNEVVTATATNVTCKNVTVTYGDWMNYHYCEGYWNRGWGRYESSDYVGGVDQEEPHNHADGESHKVCIPFNQLFGGSSNGSGHYPVKGLAEFPGVTVNYPESFYREQGYKVEGDKYTVYSGAGFKDIATTVLNDGSKNVTIELANNIDLAGIEWPAVKTAAAFVLDGKGYAIKNLTTSAVEDHGFYSTAMFTSTRKATTIKNLVVENATVTGKGGDNSHGAVLVACNYAALNIEGVTVKNSTVSNCDRSSVIATYLYFTNATVKDCVVEGCTVNSIGTAGALLGMNNSHDFEATGNTVKNTTISSSEGSNKAGILIGTWQDAGTLTESNNVVENSKAINAGTETNNNVGRHA